MEKKQEEALEIADLATTEDPQGGLTALSALNASALQSFSVLRLRSAGAAGYDIWAPSPSAKLELFR